MNHKPPPAMGLLGSVALLLITVGPRLFGQSVASSEASSTGISTEEAVVLSPFVVDAAKDQGNYLASSTLAGTRVRTDLRDVPSALSVVTSDFLRDTGATNNQTLLVYTPNTEVGGLYGNYAGVGSTFINGATETGLFLKPANNTRVRGLDSADNTRDYFQSDIPWDAFNVDRIDLQRGPNSILFGLGSPAGIINASVNTAGFTDANAIENRVGSFGSVRTTIDVNHVLRKDELSVRLALLDDNTKYRQDPAFNHDRRAFAALTWSPKFKPGDDSSRTTFRANFERGTVTANRPRILPPEDRITPFFDPNGINKQAWDPSYAWQVGILPQDDNHFTDIGEPKNYWVDDGRSSFGGNNAAFTYDSTTTNGGSPIFVRQTIPGQWGGLGPDGAMDHNYGGANFNTPIAITGYNGHATSVNYFNPDQFPAATSGFYKNRAITDRSIFDFYNHLIDGPNKREWQNWTAYNLSAEQTLFHDRLGLQLVYDRQQYHDGQERNLKDPFISVDINATTMDYPFGYSEANGYSDPYVLVANPNAGRAYVSGSGAAGNSGTISDRENLRAIVTGELRAADLLKDSRWAKILGRHVFTGLLSDETYSQENRTWARYALDYSWSDAIGTGINAAQTDTAEMGTRIPALVTYLSGPLFNVSSASGLQLQPINAIQAPAGAASIRYNDSRWKWSMDPNASDYVDPGAEWINPNSFYPEYGPSNVFTESENALNYVGWTNGSFPILNADQGDRDQLYTALSTIQKKTRSTGLTWQGYLLDDLVVATVGWRRDRQEQRAGTGTFSSALGYVPLGYELNPLNRDNGIATGDSVSWGIVAHLPQSLQDRLPGKLSLSAFYNIGKNSRVENRYGFDASPLPNAKGKTTDYGFVVGALDDRVQFKATFYKTDVQDANLASVTTASTTLGSGVEYLYALEAWGTASALTDQAYIDGSTDAPNWYANWAYVDNGFDEAYDDPSFVTAEEKASIRSWLDQMQPQSWFDAFGYKVDVAKAQAGNWQNSIAAWIPNGNIGTIQPAGAGQINGVYPNGTVNNESKGVEFELIGRPRPNWNVSINASKQTASQVSLGQDLSNFIEMQHAKFETPAGDLRLWWGGDLTVRDYYQANVWAAYLFQKETNGKMVPEMSPWRFNLVTDYKFQNDALRGINVGGAYRWQQGTILGYALNDAKDNLDVDRPFWGKSNEAVDLWIGYERPLSEKLNWRIQLNVRGVNSSTHLEPISIQPDGSPAGYRIVEGRTWELSNTLSF